MLRFARVPWLRWKRFQVDGVVREQGSGRPLPGLVVRAFDKDVVKDDHLGDAVTDAAGRFAIRFSDVDFKDLTESRPDLYLCVFGPAGGEPIHDTAAAVRHDAGDSGSYEIEIPADRVPPG